MTYSAFLSLCSDAAECDDFDQFCAECGGSVPPECVSGDGSVDFAVNLLQFCWSYGRDRSFPALHRLSGLSHAALSRAYQIPLRTIEDWLRGVRKPPVYVTDLLAFAVCCDMLPRQIGR